MIAYLIYNKYESERNAWFINELIKSFEKCGIKLELIIEEHLILEIGNKPIILYHSDRLTIPDFVLNRTNNYLIALQFESLGVKVFNDSSVSRLANNKYLSYLMMSSHNIPVLHTRYCTKRDINNITSYPNVLKTLDGKGGNGVFLCNDYNELLDNVSKINSEYFIIQDVASELGKDLRVYVLGNKIYQAILRVNNGGFKSNYCLGNEAYIYELNNSEISIVNKIISIKSFDYVGIDFLFDNGHLVFNEIEDSVGARMLYDKTSLKATDDIAKYINSIIK